MNTKQRPGKTPESTYATARANLLLMIGFTVANVVLTLFKANVYLLFSATMPLLAADLGVVMDAEGLTAGATIIGVIIAAIIVCLYVLCWVLSKKRGAWMTVAMVLFALDTGLMLLMFGITADMILDVVFHAYVLYYLISGVVAWNKMKKQPAAQLPTPVDPAYSFADPAVPQTPPVMVNGEPMTEETAAE